MMSSSLRFVLIASAAAALCGAIDLELESITCNAGLPIYAVDNGLKMRCGSDTKCTFGETAHFSGHLYYENVDKVSLTDYTAYASADLSLLTVEYHLFDSSPVSLCGSWISNAEYNYNNCPQNGTYYFDMNYTLPTSDNALTSWLATGWEGSALLELRSGPSQSNGNNTFEKLASCTIQFKTHTTGQAGSALGNMPSAATTTIGLLVAIAALACLICLCACTPTLRRRRRRLRGKGVAVASAPASAPARAPAKSEVSKPTTGQEDPASEFYRMDEEAGK